MDYDAFFLCAILSRWGKTARVNLAKRPGPLRIKLGHRSRYGMPYRNTCRHVSRRFSECKALVQRWDALNNLHVARCTRDAQPAINYPIGIAGVSKCTWFRKLIEAKCNFNPDVRECRGAERSREELLCLAINEIASPIDIVIRILEKSFHADATRERRIPPIEYANRVHRN